MINLMQFIKKTGMACLFLATCNSAFAQGGKMPPPQAPVARPPVATAPAGTPARAAVVKPMTAPGKPATAPGKPATAAGKPPATVRPTLTPKTAIAPANTAFRQPVANPLVPYGSAIGQPLHGANFTTGANGNLGLNGNLGGNLNGTGPNGNLGANGLITNAGSSTNLNGNLATANGQNFSANGALTPQQAATQRMATGQQAMGLQGVSSNPQIQARGGLPTTATQNGLTGAGATGNGQFNSLLQQRLNLSNGQLSQINQFQTSYNQELNQLSNRFRSDPQGTTDLVTQARQQLQNKINSVMTPQQRQGLSQITGTPDTFSTASPLQNPASTTTGTNNLGANGTTGLGANNLNFANFTGLQSSTNNPNPMGRISNTTALGTNVLRVGSGGFLAVSNPSVQQALQLTPAQLSQLQKFQLNYIQQLGNLNGHFQTDPQGTLTLYKNALQQSNQQIQSVLTPQQRQIFSSLSGAPAEVSEENTLQSTTPSE